MKTQTTKLNRAKRFAALKALYARMIALVPDVPEDDLQQRDVSVRRLRAAGQIARILETI